MTIDEEQGSYIHTVNYGNKRKPTIVLVHGYWSACPTFLKLLKPLGNYFNIYAIDLLGFGLSSRTAFGCQTPEESIDFFVESIDRWREEMKIKKFTLLGISFGGYICASYALKYQKYLDRLLLLSPLGICKGDDPASKSNKNHNVVYYITEGNKVWRTFFYQIFSALWNRMTVSDLYQKRWFPFSYWLLESYLKQWTNKDVDREHWRVYYDKIMKLPVTAEWAMQRLLYFPSFYVKKPLCDDMHKLAVPCHFFYGEFDWMENKASLDLIQTQQLKGTYSIIKNSGHMLTYDHPQTLCDRFKELRII